MRVAPPIPSRNPSPFPTLLVALKAFHGPNAECRALFCFILFNDNAYVLLSFVNFHVCPSRRRFKRLNVFLVASLLFELPNFGYETNQLMYATARNYRGARGVCLGLDCPRGPNECHGIIQSAIESVRWNSSGQALHCGKIFEKYVPVPILNLYIF